MMTDALLLLSNAQNLTTGTINSTNVIDLSQARDIGEGEDLYASITVPTSFAGGTSLTANVVVADDAALTQNVTPIGSTAAIPVANLSAGARFAVRLNPQIGSLGHRYLAIQYVCGGTFTQGAVTSSIVQDISDSTKFYPSGFQII